MASVRVDVISPPQPAYPPPAVHLKVVYLYEKSDGNILVSEDLGRTTNTTLSSETPYSFQIRSNDKIIVPIDVLTAYRNGWVSDAELMETLPHLRDEVRAAIRLVTRL